MRLPWVLLLLFCAATASAAEPPAQVVRCTYQRCLERALERSPLLKAARLGVDNYEAKLREAKSTAHPKFEISGFASVLPSEKPGAAGDNPFTDYDFAIDKLGPLAVGGVALAQPLYTFGKIDALKTLARQGVDIAQTTVRVAEDEMRYQLARAFWGLVLVRELQDLIVDGRKMLTEQRERLEKLRDAGDEAYNQSDMLKLNVYAAEVEQITRQFERMNAQALDGMRVAMGDGWEVQVQPDADLSPVHLPDLPSEAYETLALANSPKLLAMRKGVAARLQQVEVQRTQLYPDLVLVARLAGTYAPTRFTTPDSLATNPSNTASSGAGVALRWNLDWSRTFAKIDQAEAEWHQAVEGEKGERAKARMEVRQMVREMRDARAMIAVQEAAYKSARSLLDEQNRLYEDGLVDDNTELLRALEQYSRRRIAFSQAIYDFNLAVAALSRAVGMDVTTVRTVPATPAAQ